MIACVKNHLCQTSSRRIRGADGGENLDQVGVSRLIWYWFQFTRSKSTLTNKDISSHWVFASLKGNRVLVADRDGHSCGTL
jgi:hypothetical protein